MASPPMLLRPERVLSRPQTPRRPNPEHPSSPTYPLAREVHAGSRPALVALRLVRGLLGARDHVGPVALDDRRRWRSAGARSRRAAVAGRPSRGRARGPRHPGSPSACSGTRPGAARGRRACRIGPGGRPGPRRRRAELPPRCASASRSWSRSRSSCFEPRLDQGSRPVDRARVRLCRLRAHPQVIQSRRAQPLRSAIPPRADPADASVSIGGTIGLIGGGDAPRC